MPKDFAKNIKDGLSPIVDLVYPPRCPSCGVSTATHGALCQECWTQLEFPAGNDGTGDDQSAHSKIIAATIYNDMSRSLILKFKHGGKLALAPLLGRMMASRIHAFEDSIPLVIPVPLHRTRIWQRGFNQAAMLAREIAKTGKGELLIDGLVRQKRTPSLGNMTSEERHKVLQGAITVRKSAKQQIRGRSVVVVDDVLTSGATSGASVEALLAVGACDVSIACFARTRGSLVST